VVRSLLDLLPLVERSHSVNQLLVREELKYTVRSDQDYFVLLAQGEFCFGKEIHMISGRGLTPTEAATRSPKLRVIASPGTLSFCTQTLKGPIGSPYSSIKGYIRPFIFLIRSAYFYTEGLWSFERGIASHLLALYLPKTALLSPTLAQYSLFCCR
jgi:hypothetical protein